MIATKVRVSYTSECSDWWRRAIRRWYGLDGLATREECRDWLKRYGSSMEETLVLDQHARAPALGE